MTRGGARADVAIDASLAARLVRAQFPQWADLPVRAVAVQGHDNRTFRLGDALSVRLPSAERYAAQIEREAAWLPRLAARLPLPIPVPVALGAPGPGYPWRFSINPWLAGDSATVAAVADRTRFARDLAAFLNALAAIDASEGPAPGPDNFFRGGDLAVYDGETRACIRRCGDRLDARAATRVWESALAARAPAPPVWVHGDVAASNLLVAGGELCAVIDFGQLAVGDPACDVAIAWTFFSAESRAALRSDLARDDATWARGRGWCLWKALLTLSAAPADPAARRILDAVLAG
ncbi:MAG TPA: aminoglycoside phosphotransferase family protein [Myxococcota bacterium]